MSKIAEKSAGLITGATSALITIAKAPINIASTKSGALSLSGIAIAAGLGFYLQKRLRLVGKDEQLFIETATEQRIVNGPRIALMPPVIKKHKVKKAVRLSKLEYCIVRNELTGISRNEVRSS